MSGDIRLAKTRLSKVIQSGELFWALLGKCVSPLIKVVVTLARKANIASASAIDGAIQRCYVWMRGHKSRKRNHLTYFEWRYGRY